MSNSYTVSIPHSGSDAKRVDVDSTSNPLIQEAIPETLNKITSALNDVKNQFVFDDSEIHSVQMSGEMYDSAADALGQIIEATEHVENRIKSKWPIGSELLKAATELCNELDELMAAQRFFYLAVEGAFTAGKTTESSGCGPTVFSHWLCERSFNALDEFHRFQEMLRVAFR
jgi:hypothetical protein